MSIASVLIKIIPFADPILAKLSKRYKMHPELVNALENLTLLCPEDDENKRYTQALWDAAALLKKAKEL